MENEIFITGVLAAEIQVDAPCIKRSVVNVGMSVKYLLYHEKIVQFFVATVLIGIEILVDLILTLKGLINQRIVIEMT